jgi:hypothetical protein
LYVFASKPGTYARVLGKVFVKDVDHSNLFGYQQSNMSSKVNQAAQPHRIIIHAD